MNHRLRLTLSYLGVIMVISIFFSGLLYAVTVGETSRGLTRQQAELKPNLYFVKPEKLDDARDIQLSSYKRRVISRLVLLNLGMLALGAGFSYLLAKRNLDPLEESMAAQSRFTSDAAHELRTPLTAMKSETEVGLRDKSLNMAGARSLLKSNLEEVAKLETLTSALLRLAKNGSTPDMSTWKNVAIKDVVDKAVTRLTSEAAEADITILTNDMGQQKINGDFDQLVEMVVVLLDNAIKYGRPKSAITIKSKTNNDQVELRIADKGIGIKQSDLPHIFERFYRADQSRNKKIVSGFGLGLSLAQQIAQAHRGTITAESEIGQGSVFTVKIPVNRA